MTRSETVAGQIGDEMDKIYHAAGHGMPLVVVQVISYWSEEGKKDLQDLFASLEMVDYPRDRWRIVVIDNPSPHGRAADYIKRQWLVKAGVTLPEITLIESDVNDGFSGGHQRGWQVTRGFSPDYLYLLNQDAAVEPQFLWRVVQSAEERPTCVATQSRIMLKQTPELLNTRGNALHFLGFGFTLGYRTPPLFKGGLEGDTPAFYASGAGVLLRASVLEKIGGLFESTYFMYHEDVDVCWRARLAGYDVCYADDSVIYHRYEFSRSIKKFYWMERNRHLTNLINYKIPTLLLIAPAALVMELGTLYFAVKSGWGEAKMKSWMHFFKPSTWVFIARRRSVVRGVRVATDRQMLQHMVGVIANQEVNNLLLTKLVNPLLQIYFWILKLIVRW
ncbi:MAG: glycosyltransferase family 2 protein [Patescibacteria group bacterium]